MYSWISLDSSAHLPPDARALRETLGRFATGVCLVTTLCADGKRAGMTINSFASVSLDPPLVLWGINNDARSAAAFLSAPGFNLSVLGARQKPLALHFARPAEDKFGAFEGDFVAGRNGIPRLRAALATYECSVFSRHREGDHTLLIGRVEHFAGEAADPLLFHAGKMGALAELAGVLA
ncbi:MAG TPA: flavin reductase family protein [Burkholderiales bacterium]|nr:flavin reductase family protein [Burkholderiales bacterium]